MRALGVINSTRGSLRSRRRMQRRRTWAIVRGVATFVIMLGLLLLSAWQAGDLRRRAPEEPAQQNSTTTPASESALPPADLSVGGIQQSAVPAAVREARGRPIPLRPPQGPTMTPMPDVDVLSAAELEAISQARSSVAIP